MEDLRPGDDDLRDVILFDLLDRFDPHWKRLLTWEQQQIVEETEPWHR